MGVHDLEWGGVFRDKGGQVYDVTHPTYGATGDGVADDTSEIQAALTAADAAGGGAVFLPVGTYKITGTLNVPSDVVLKGAGDASIVNYVGTSGPAIAMNDAATDGVYEWRSTLRDFKLTTTAVTGGTIGIRLRNVYGARIEGVHVTGFLNCGIDLSALGGSGAEFCNRIHHNYILGNGRGIRITGTNAHNQNTITCNRIQGSYVADGIVADQECKGFYIAGNDCEGNTGSEMTFNSGLRGSVVEANWLETNAAANYGIVLTGAGLYQGTVFQGNHLSCNHGTPTGTAFYLGSSGANAFIGLVLNGNQVTGYAYGIDFVGRVYKDCDFDYNYWSVTTKYVNLPAVASTGNVLEKFSKVATINFASLGTLATDLSDVTITGIKIAGMYEVTVTPTRLDAGVGIIAVPEVGFVWSGHVVADDTVRVYCHNATGGTVNPISRDYVISVTRFS